MFRRRPVRNTLAWLALVTFAFGSLAFAQRSLTVSGIHVDDIVELPSDMRLGLFAAQGGIAADVEIASVRMVAGTFSFVVPGTPPDERFLRPLVSGSFPLAFMIGNEFIASRDGVFFTTAVLHPYQDRCLTDTFDPLRDLRFAFLFPELPNFGGLFNLVYVTEAITLRTTPKEFVLQPGWNVILSKFEAGRIVYDVASSLDITIVSSGPTLGMQELLPCP
jgi:hypothetical protein